MRKEKTFNQGLDENLICRSLDARSRSTQKKETDLRHNDIGEYIKNPYIAFSIILSMTIFSFPVYAECVPAPDCASIGYTETSCEGGFVRCPFDTSKLYCLPCDSSYKYDCSGSNITGGVGSACGGKYVSCSCSGGGTFNNGACPQNCTVGMFYYSDKSCSSTYDSSKTAIGVVVKDNELVLSRATSDYSNKSWGTYGNDLSLDDLTSGQAKGDFNGKTNTATIIAEDSGAKAAKYCNNYTIEGTSAGDWYLPALGELYYYVYGNYSTIGTAMSLLDWDWEADYWSSSEYNDIYAWTISIYSGNITVASKNDDGHYTTKCFLNID